MLILRIKKLLVIITITDLIAPITDANDNNPLQVEIFRLLKMLNLKRYLVNLNTNIINLLDNNKNTSKLFHKTSGVNLFDCKIKK
jgi:hypothetical protein